MKKRRLVISCFVLVVCLAIGIGYAAIESRLAGEIDFNLGTNTTDYQVVFTANSKADTATEGATVTATTAYSVKPKEGNQATLDILIPSGVFTEKGQKITVVAEIQNNSTQYRATFDANTPPTVTYVTTLLSGEPLSDHVNVTCSMPADTDLAPGETTTMTIVITVVKMPTTPIENANVRIAVTHQAAELELQ